MQKAKVVDISFAHSVSCSDNPLKHFEWDRSIEPLTTDPIFFVDQCLGHVDVYPRSRRKIALLLEPPAVMPYSYQYVQKNSHKFDYILSHNEEWGEQFGHKYLYYMKCMRWIKDEDISEKNLNSPKGLSMIASNKNFASGHSMRHNIIRKFIQSNQSPEIDLYGRGWNEIPYKGDGLIPYKFSIAVENSILDTYFTEKILDCFAAGTIPIYYGTNKIEKFFDSAGIWFFKTMTELENILNVLSDPEQMALEYERCLSAVKYNMATVKNLRSPEDWIYENYPWLFK